MTIDEPVLIQVYATVLTGIFIFMTVQRLFEGKGDYEKESKRLNQEKEDAEKDKETNTRALTALHTSWTRYQNPKKEEYKNQTQKLKTRIKAQDVVIEKINTQISSLDNRYNRKITQYRSIKIKERRLNIVMVSFIVSAIIGTSS